MREFPFAAGAAPRRRTRGAERRIAAVQLSRCLRMATMSRAIASGS